MKELTKLQIIIIFVLILVITGIFLSQYKDPKYLAAFLVCVSLLTLILLNLIRVFSLKSFGNLEDTKGQLEIILNTIPGFVSWIDKDLIYLGVNKSLSDFFRIKPEDFIGKKLGSISLDEEGLLIENAQKLFEEDKKKIQCEISFMRDKKRYWSLLTMQKYNYGESALLVSIDITDLKKTQLKLKEEEANSIHNGRLAALGEMIGTITHEISNPLTIIASSNKIISSQIQQESPDQERINQSVEICNKALTKIDKIIMSTKNLVRDGSIDKKVDSSLNEIFDDVLLFISKKCADKNIILHVDKPENDISLKCSPVQISQALLILLNNAIDAVEKNEERWIQIVVNKKTTKLVISVIDSGEGISVELADKIFESFFTTKKLGKGTGIGLGLAKKIINSHGGKLNLDQKSEHTKFNIILPDKEV